jgi:hypothetical protein
MHTLNSGIKTINNIKVEVINKDIPWDEFDGPSYGTPPRGVLEIYQTHLELFS